MLTGAIGAAVFVPTMLTSRAARASDVLPGSFASVSPLIVRLSLLKPRPSMTQDQFVEHWRRVRAPLLLAAPGVARCALNLADPAQSVNFPYAAAEELWLDGEPALDGAGSSKGKLADDLMRIAMPGGPVLVSREIIIRPAPASGPPLLKRIGFVDRPKGWDEIQFAKEWRDGHAPAVAKSPTLKGYTVNIVERRLSPENRWAGFASLWWLAPDPSTGPAPKMVAPPGAGDPFAAEMALIGEEIVGER